MAVKFEDWQDVKVAFEVARLGTLTAAAEALNVHHSTVLRRINNLEKNLNTRLFIAMLVAIKQQKQALSCLVPHK